MDSYLHRGCCVGVLLWLFAGVGTSLAAPIVYSANGDLWLLEPSTSTSIQLTSHPAFDGYPSWSPDGERIVFVSTRKHQLGELYTIRPDGSDLVAIGSWGTHPAYSPDGGSLVYTTGHRLIVSTATGADPFVVFSTPEGDESITSPAWDPTGRWLVFGISPGFLYTMDTAEAPCSRIPFGESVCPSLFRLLNGRVDDSRPSWSPDGQWIAFTDHTRIALVRPNGTGLRQLTDEALLGSEPTWSPTGDSLAFVGGHPERNLYIMARDGSGVRQLTQVGNVRTPAWQRAGTTASSTLSWGLLKRSLH